MLKTIKIRATTLAAMEKAHRLINSTFKHELAARVMFLSWDVIEIANDSDVKEVEKVLDDNKVFYVSYLEPAVPANSITPEDIELIRNRKLAIYASIRFYPEEKQKLDAAMDVVAPTGDKSYLSNRDRFFSHRSSGGRDGRMLAYLGIPG